MCKSWIVEIGLHLQIERPNELSVLMLAPFFHVFIFLQRHELLSLKLVDHCCAELVIDVKRLVFINKLLGFGLTARAIALPIVEHPLKMLDNFASEFVLNVFDCIALLQA